MIGTLVALQGLNWAKILGGEMERQGEAMSCFGGPRRWVGKKLNYHLYHVPEKLPTQQY